MAPAPVAKLLRSVPEPGAGTVLEISMRVSGLRSVPLARPPAPAKEMHS